jgi:hypothetical protein
MPARRTRDKRAKVTISVDAALLNAIDSYVQRHGDLDRSKVMEAALQNWYSARQDEAMIEQFIDTDQTPTDEYETWRMIRRSAASRRFGRPESLRSHS